MTFLSVSFLVLSFILFTGEKIRIGGFTENTLKKENGLRLHIPLLSIVLTSAIGRGATLVVKCLYNSSLLIEFTSISIILINFIIRFIRNNLICNLT